MKDLISKRTRNSFRDYLSDNSVLREIIEYFENHDIKKTIIIDTNIYGERRNKVHEYYNSINWKDYESVNKIILVYQDILSDILMKINLDINYNDLIKLRFEELVNNLKMDGFRYENSKLILDVSANDHIINYENILNKADLQLHFERIRSSIDKDPALAIGSTKELIESVLKTILDKKEIMYNRYDDIPKLLKLVQRELDLVPKDVNEEKKGNEYIKSILSSLGSIVIKTSELRNLYGTGHGQSNLKKGLNSRHARLVVGSGITLVTFLIETYEIKNNTTF